MLRAIPGPLAVALLLGAGAGCVSTSTHEAVLAELDQTNKKLATTQEQLQDTTSELKQENEKASDLDEKLTVALEQNQSLVTKVSSMGQNVEQLLGEKDQMKEERQRLKREVDELQRMRAAAEARNAEYKKLLGKLAKMIDAGTLNVKVRNGLMVVTMSNDVLFPPGGVRLKSEAQAAIAELAQELAAFQDRKFQVIGHSDPTPIRTSRFPSNWELSSQRAIEVVKVMINAGLPPNMVYAAGAAEFDPLVSNDNAENMAQNRRVEVVFVPKIDELPGFEKMLSAAN